jgi:NAD(P)-dependent dehydrogenase (short-subunit alcohol dehydrogenase family)
MPPPTITTLLGYTTHLYALSVDHAAAARRKVTNVTQSRVAVVTGAAQGIGRRVAEVLAADGFVLALLDRAPVTGFDPHRTLEFVGDVSDPEVASTVAATVHERFGAADVLVNNAGVACVAPAEETTPAMWQRVLDVNLTGPFLLSQAFGRGMLRRGCGAIVNVASVAGLRGVTDRVAYNASKHGLIGLTRTLAVEWAGRGVRVNAVCPGWVKTGMDVANQADGAYDDRDITTQVPLARFAQPDDVAQAVAFLADPARSGFITGAALPVDGGWSAEGSWLSLRMSTRER